jgi:DNA-binding NarL/FixJ family response regulator
VNGQSFAVGIFGTGSGLDCDAIVRESRTVYEGATEGRDGIVGRDSELAAVRGWIADDRAARGMVLCGDAGVGKTTLWEAGIEVARERGLRVLIARASGAETRLSFATLIDVCDGIDTAAVAGVPAPQLRALEAALLRAEPTPVAAQPHAIALGLLNLLRVLAAQEPLLVAIDDLPWIDPPSADALAFVARRLRSERVRFLLAKRPASASALEQALSRRGLDRLDVGPLSFGATRQLLFDRLGLSLSRELLRRIVESTLGNPLFTLEVGRTLADRGVPEIGQDVPVPDTVEELLGTRVGGLPGPIRTLLLALALSADLRPAELAGIASAAALEDAVEGGVLLVEGERVRPSHPLLAAAARKRSRPRERRELHLALAGSVGDAELRALHLALATERPDERLAALVATAAAGAYARGARTRAIVLAEHALRLSPPGSPSRGDRLLGLAWYLDVAGEMQRLEDLLAPELSSLPPGRMRGRAWLLLRSQRTGLKTTVDIERHLELALAECHGDPSLRAYVLAKDSANAAAGRVAGIRAAERWALEALQAPSDPGLDLPRLALYALGWTRALTGNSIDELCELSRAESDDSSYLAATPERVAGQRLVWRGELPRARAVLTGLLTLADERGEAESYALARLHLCELELRAGDWDAAAGLLDEWAESSEAELLYRPMYERCMALLASGRGAAEDAERWANDAITRAEETGSGWDRLEALRARGTAALLTHDPQRAIESLGAVWEHTEREGVEEPGVFPVAPEFVEALTEFGELDTALVVTGRLRELAERQQHPWGLATTKRCAAIIALASGDGHEDAAVALAQAAEDYRRLGLRCDQARSLLGVGRAQRRRRKWGAARSSLHEAIACFEQLGATGWAEHTRSELARVGARRPSPAGQLTATERRVATLAAEGLSNKEISQALYVSVYTVETHLSRAFRKLGVRSRTQLAGRLSTDR